MFNYKSKFLYDLKASTIWGAESPGIDLHVLLPELLISKPSRFLCDSNNTLCRDTIYRTVSAQYNTTYELERFK